MNDDSLGIDEHVTRVEAAPEDGLASLVGALGDMELQLSIVWELVVAIERTDEHRWETPSGKWHTCLALNFLLHLCDYSKLGVSKLNGNQ
jgi:hypothetical protein